MRARVAWAHAQYSYLVLTPYDRAVHRIGEPCRQTESTWAAVRLGAGQFSAVLAPGASGHRLFALQLQRGRRRAAQPPYVRLVPHARRGVVNPASLDSVGGHAVIR